MLQGVKHIIFDLGGVILNIDYNRTEQAFIDLGISDFPAHFSKLHQTALFDKWEMGQVTREDFIAALQAVDAPVPVTEQQIVDAWNAMLLDFPLRRLQLLQQLRLHYDVFLLSNTNEIHEDAFNDILMCSHGMPGLGVFFDKVYYSHRVGLRKPMKEIYELVLNENGLKPEATVFIDDGLKNIEGAQAVGLQTIFLDKGMTIETDVFRPKE